jgi:hypothetical protein
MLQMGPPEDANAAGQLAVQVLRIPQRLPLSGGVCGPGEDHAAGVIRQSLGGFRPQPAIVPSADPHEGNCVRTTFLVVTRC